MTTELLELDRGSSADTDVSPPERSRAERAKAEVVRAWFAGRKSSTWRSFSRLHLSGGESYDIDVEPWRHFDRLLSAYSAFAFLAGPGGIAGRMASNTVITDSADDVEKVDRRRRYAELSKLLDEWASGPSEFDERVAPLIEEALRESAPRHSPGE